MWGNLQKWEGVEGISQTSRRSLTAYENSKSGAGLSKFQEIFRAIGYDIKIYFIPKDK